MSWLLYHYSPPAVSSLASIIDHLITAYPGALYAIGLSLIGCSAIIVLFRFFRKSSISEMFLAIVAVGTLAFESVRLVYFFLQHYQQPLVYFEFVSRALVFFHITGMIGFFFVSILILGIQYQKVNNILYVQGIIGLMFAYSLPIRTTMHLSFATHPVGGPFTYTTLMGGITFLSVLNILFAWIQQRSMQNWRINTGCGMMVIGRCLSIVLPSGYRVLGIVILVAGLILFSREQYERYLWN